MRQDYHYVWLEIFQIEEKSFEFKKLQEMELYVHHDMLAEGHFHESCLTHKRIGSLRKRKTMITLTKFPMILQSST